MRSQRERHPAGDGRGDGEKGYVRHLGRRRPARREVSRETFYEQFESKEDCFMAARGRRRAAPRGRSPRPGAAPAGRRSSASTRGLGAYLDALAAEPGSSRGCSWSRSTPPARRRSSAGPRLQQRFADALSATLGPAGRRPLRPRGAGRRDRARWSRRASPCGDVDGLRALRARRSPIWSLAHARTPMPCAADRARSAAATSAWSTRSSPALIGAATGGGPPNVFTTLARHRGLFRRWLRFAGGADARRARSRARTPSW